MIDQIVAETDPLKLEACGRMVTPFNEELWKSHLEDTSFEIVRQKFEADSDFAFLLLSTEDALILNAEQDDRIWGAGISVIDVVVHGISVWDGTNLLGEALMRVRDTAFDTQYLLDEALMESPPH